MKRFFKSVWTSIKELGSVLKQAGIAWIDDDVTMHAASVAYYTVFSLAPMLVIALAVAGMVFDPATVQREIMTQLQGLMGTDAARSVAQFVQGATGEKSHGVLATIIGVFTLILGAIGAFVQLQDSLNHIWKVPPQGGGIVQVLRRRLLSFGLVLAVAFLLMVSLVLSTALAATGNLLHAHFTGFDFAINVANGVLSFVVIGVLFGAMFKFLPDAKIGWRDVAAAAIFTSALFTIGKEFIGLYIGQTGIASSYGAAGSLAVLLVWVYYSAMIVLFGAEFAWVVATSHERAGTKHVKARSHKAIPRAHSPAH